MLSILNPFRKSQKQKDSPDPYLQYDDTSTNDGASENCEPSVSKTSEKTLKIQKLEDAIKDSSNKFPQNEKDHAKYEIINENMDTVSSSQSQGSESEGQEENNINIKEGDKASKPKR